MTDDNAPFSTLARFYLRPLRPLRGVARTIRARYPNVQPPTDNESPWLTPAPAYCVGGALCLWLDSLAPEEAAGDVRFPSGEDVGKAINQAREKLERTPLPEDIAERIGTHITTCQDLGWNRRAWVALSDALSRPHDQPLPWTEM